MSVYSYSRVSTQAQANEGESLEVQQRQIEGWCHMHGLKIDRVFVERAISGSVPVAQRPEGAVMWTQLERGDTIIAAKLDRLFRSALDALQAVEELRTKGVSLVLLDLGGDISGNGLSKLFLTIAAAFAEAERDRIRDRIKQVKRDQRARRRYLGGRVPFGYQTTPAGDLTPLADEQRIIRNVLERRRDGMPLRAIQAGVEEGFGRRLSLDALHRITREERLGENSPPSDT